MAGAVDLAQELLVHVSHSAHLGELVGHEGRPHKFAHVGLVVVVALNHVADVVHQVRDAV